MTTSSSSSSSGSSSSSSKQPKHATHQSTTTLADRRGHQQVNQVSSSLSHPGHKTAKGTTGHPSSSESLDDILSRNKKRSRSASDVSRESWTTTTNKAKASKQSVAEKEQEEEQQQKNGVHHQFTTASPAHDTTATTATVVVVPSGHLSGMSVDDAVRDTVGCRPRANSTDGELKLPQRGLCDERTVLQHHVWSKQNGFGRGVAPQGFHNLGNTCFLNSTLQCLAYLPPFAQSLMGMPPFRGNSSSQQQQHQQQQQQQKPSQGKKVTLILRNLFRQVHGTNGLNDSTVEAISPRAIVKNLPVLSSIGSRSGYKFRPGRQEDAHEFLVHLLDAMNDGELREAGINQNVSGWRDRLPIPRLDETTFVHRVFGGYQRSQVKCTDCGYCSNTYDPFLDLSLEVSRKSCQSISDAFAEYTRKETLDSRNKWKCSGCKKRVCAQKQLTVFRPPLSLCIQLKRFAYSGMGFGGFGFGGFGGFGGGKKISKPIEFPARMRLPLSDGRSCAYTLNGIVIHVGGSASSGHYTAYVKKPGSEKWYHMDDSFVEPVSERTVLQQQDAYLLFYSRQEVKLEFPTPPLKSMSAEQAVELNRIRDHARIEKEQVAAARQRHVVTASSTSSSSSTEAESSAAEKATTSDSESSTSSSSESHSSSSELDGSSTSSEDISTTMAVIDGGETSPPKVDGRHDSDQLVLRESILQAAKTEKSSSEGENSSSSESEDENVKDSKISVLEPDTQNSVRPAAAGSKNDISSSSPSASSTSPESSELCDQAPPKRLASSYAPGRTPAPQNQNASPEDTKMPKRTKIVLDRGVGRGKVEVMLGPRHKHRSWKPHGAIVRGDVEYNLLGNMAVDRWDDEDGEGDDHSGRKHDRSKLVKQIETKETERKRKMFLDRWDAMLDQGKVSCFAGRNLAMHSPTQLNVVTSLS